MMAAEAKIYVEFGSGTLAVGGFKVDDPELWCVSIRELKEAAPVGTMLPQNSNTVGQTEIVLSFITENQMISVLAAFTNKSFEIVHNKWKNKKLDKEAQ